MTIFLRYVSTSAFALAATLTVFAVNSAAQEGDPSGSTGSEPSRGRPATATETLRQPSATAKECSPERSSATATAGGSHVECRPNFWVVSSRPCRQQGRRGCIHCRFDFFHSCPAEHLHAGTREQFFESLRPGVPLCIMVHGSFVPWQTATTDFYRSHRWIRQGAPNRPLHVVFFAWPSEGFFTADPTNGLPSLLPGLDLKLLGRRAEFNGFYLAQFISALSSDHPVSLIGHSHGVRTVCSALHLFGGGCVQGRCLPQGAAAGHRLRAVLTAAAIDHHWLNPGRRFGNALFRAEGVLNVRNRRDLPLAFYPLHKPFTRAALGRKGWTEKDRARLGWLNQKAVEMDVTPLVGRSHLWREFYSRPQLATAISPYVYYLDESGR